MLFVQLSMVLTDINVFRKLLVSAVGYEPKNKVLRSANSQIACNLIYVICGKIFEGWQKIDLRTVKEKDPANAEYLECRCEKNWFLNEYVSYLDSKGKEYLLFLENYFNNPGNKILTIRNKIASHYDSKKMEKYLDASGEIGFTIHAPRSRLESMFSNGHFIFMGGFLNDENSLINIVDDIRRVSTSFSMLIFRYNKIIWERYLGDPAPNLIDVPDPEPTDNVFSNFFKDPIS